MTVHMCVVILGVLRIIVLVIAKCTANAVVQICKVLSHPSKYVLICGRKCQSKVYYVLSSVWTCPVLRWVR